MPLELIKTRIDLAIIQRLRSFTHTLEQQGLHVEVGIHTENIENNPRRRPVVSATDDVTIADDENELALVVVVESSERVDSTSERVFAFGVARNLAEDELVLQFGRPLRTKLEGSQDCARKKPKSVHENNKLTANVNSHFKTILLIKITEAIISK
jgi:hypothetical protein